MMRARLTSWLLRLLLGALLLFGSEVLLWNVPYTQDAFGWARAVVGHVLIAALLLDLAARYRVRDVFGALLLAGVFATLNALAISPQTTLYDIPRTLVTRVLGPGALVGLGMMALLIWLAGRGRGAWLALAALLVGVAAGAWAHWSPVALFAAGETPLSHVYVAAGIVMAVIVVLTWATGRAQSDAPPDVRLGLLEWLVVAAGLIGLGAWQYTDGALEPVPLALAAAVSALCWAALWATARARGEAYVDLLGKFAPHWRWLGLSLLIFAAAIALGWALPRGEGAADPIAVIGGVMTAFGIVWLPTVALVLGARMLQRQTRALRL